MSLSLTIAAIWVVLSAIVAMLPMGRQFGPGIFLLLSAPLMVGFIGYEHGFLIAGVGLFAFLSMFRRPLIYLTRKALGRPAPLPPELEDPNP